jgi:2',3'-cyclic-nucleotide 2'-phosphodiesterase (5'-nucleotidase family)
MIMAKRFVQRATVYASRSSVLLTIFLAGAVSVMAQPAAQPQGSASQPRASEVRSRVTETLVDSSLDDDPAVGKMVAVYSPKVRELDVLIGRLHGELKKGGIGAGSMGNFVTDGMRWQATTNAGKTIALAVTNAGGLRRSTIVEGELRVRDIFELLPFENALLTVDLTGEQLKRLLETVLTANEAQSGARVVYRTTADKKNEAQNIKLRETTGDNEIDPTRTYTIVTIDYLYNVGGPRYSILREGTNMKMLGITLREAVINYVKSETAAGRDIKPNLDGRFSTDQAISTTGEAKPE